MAIRTRQVGDLPPGTPFELRDPVLGGEPVRGIAVRTPPSRGYTKVRIYQRASLRRLLGSGAVESKNSRWTELEWSASSLVHTTGIKWWNHKEGRMVEEGGYPGEMTDADIGDNIRRRGVTTSSVQDDETFGDMASREETPLMAKITKLKDAKKKKLERERQTPRQVKSKAPVKPANPCKCGCGELVKSNFKQGHDGRYHGWMSKVAAGKMKFADLNETVRREFKNIDNLKKAQREYEQLKAKNKADRG